MPHASKSTIDRETDARFWAQTGYRVGQRLDPGDPVDRAMSIVWRDVWSKVKREDQEGRLVLTYNHPDAERGLADAEMASHAVVAHLESATAAPDPASAAEHASAAESAAAAAGSAADAAAAIQPPTVSPSLASEAASAAAAAAGMPPPGGLALPADHPAEIADRTHVPPAEPPPEPHAPAGRDRRDPAEPQEPARSAVQGQIAVAQATFAPANAARLHERAAAGEARPEGAIRPRAISDIREVAIRIAASLPDSAAGVVCYPDGGWSAPRFRSRKEAEAWHDHLAETPQAFRYAAIFDRADPAWPAPIVEVFGSSSAVGAAPAAPIEAKPPGSGAGLVYAAGAVALILGAALMVDRGRRDK